MELELYEFYSRKWSGCWRTCHTWRVGCRNPCDRRHPLLIDCEYSRDWMQLIFAGFHNRMSRFAPRRCCLNDALGVMCCAITKVFSPWQPILWLRWEQKWIRGDRGFTRSVNWLISLIKPWPHPGRTTLPALITSPEDDAPIHTQPQVNQSDRRCFGIIWLKNCYAGHFKCFAQLYNEFTQICKCVASAAMTNPIGFRKEFFMKRYLCTGESYKVSIVLRLTLR